MDDDVIKFFSQYLTEAPEDEDAPPDTEENIVDDGPPDLDQGSDDIGGFDEGPPDMDDTFGDEIPDEEPVGDNENGKNNTGPDISNLSGKISTILNYQLYQKFLNMLTSLGGQITMLKNNNDILYSLTKDIDQIEDSLKKLDENIRIYLKNNFLNENYSKNLLFYNKCLNLISLLTESFNSKIAKGIKNND